MVKGKDFSHLRGTVFLLAFLVLSFQASYSSPRLSSGPQPKPIQLWSSIIFVYPFLETALGCQIHIRVDSGPVDNARVTIDSTRDVPRTGSGYYYAFITPYSIYANRPIDIAIRPKLALSPDEGLVTAKAYITDIIVIDSPALNEVIDLSSVDAVRIRWRYTAGGGPISELKVRETAGPAEVYSQTNLTGNSVEIKASSFQPGKQYTIILMKQLKDFAIKGFATPDSRIYLFFVVQSNFSTR